MNLLRYTFITALTFAFVFLTVGCRSEETLDIPEETPHTTAPQINEPVHRAERVDLTRLSLGVFDLANANNIAPIQSLVASFNSRSLTHYVEIIDYMDRAQGNWNNAQILLATEILGGQAPDMLFLLDLPYQSFISKGLLVDLYPFIDADPELSRDGLIENVLLALEVDENLYQLPFDFRINTIAGSESVLGNYPGWTFDEFIEIMSGNSQADVPLDPFFHSGEFMHHLTQSVIGEFVDYETGTAHFETEDFINLLEFGYRYTNDDYWDADISLQRQMITTGRHIMDAAEMGGFYNVVLLHTKFGEDIIYK